MNPFLTGLGIELGNRVLPVIAQLLSHGDEQDQNDAEAMAEELREVMAERDDLRRQLRDIRKAHEELHRALYPGLHK